MPRMTKAQHKRRDGLQEALGVAMAAVFAVAPDNRTPFSVCLTMAPADVVGTYAHAREAIAVYERELADAGRGWFNRFGQFVGN